MKDQFEVVNLIQDFKGNLGTLADNVIVQKYITFGESYVLESDEYFQLKHEISKQFGLHPSQVIVVGSGKLGFSIAPQKRYNPFGDQSDLDVAIVSGSLFDTLWLEVFEFWDDNRGAFWRKETEFKDYLFRGWLRPDYLPPSVRSASQWFEFFRKLTASGRFGSYKISAGVYRSWWYLERYHQTAVAQCKAATLGVGNEDNSD